jgi:cytochrome P450
MTSETAPVAPTTTVDMPDGWKDLQYDHRSSKVTVQPWDLWKRLRAECPAIHSDRYGGFWFVTRHEDVNRVLVDWETFTASEGVNIPRQGMVMLPLEVDPPLHRKYREILNPLLAPQSVKSFEPWIRQLAEEWVAQIADKDEFDVCTEFAEPYAKRLALRVIGFEDDDLDDLDHWTEILSVGVRDDQAGIEAGAALFGHLAATLERRARQPARADLISVILDGTLDGRPLTGEEQQSILLLLTFGGLHTTGAVLAGAIVWLADHPEDRARLRQRPELMTSAVEEFVRYVSPVTHMNRTAAKDTEIGGCPIHAGERVMFGLGSANHDERVFTDPEDVVLDRHPNHHFGFGAGPHRCVGSHLGKLGVRAGLDAFLAAFRDFEVRDHHDLRYSGGEGRGLTQAPIKVTSR